MWRCWRGLRGARREAALVGALCAAWYALSSASNVVGKLVLSEFPFPLTVCMVQLAAAALLSGPALAACGARGGGGGPPQAAPPPARALLPLAAAKCLTTLFSQVSIWKVPVSYAHTVKATTPLWTAALAWVLWGERVSRAVGGALLLIACGVAVASATELAFDGLGLGAALAAAALLSLQHLYSKRVLRTTGVPPLRLLAALSARAAALAAPLWAWRDGPALLAWRGWARAGPLLAVDGALAWLQAVAAFSVLARVTPLTYGVASAAKRAAVVAVSLLVLRNPAPPANVAGMALAALGVLAYNRAKAHERTAPGHAPLLPV